MFRRRRPGGVRHKESIVVLILMVLAGWSTDRVIRTSVALVLCGSLFAFCVLWAADYQWSNAGGCREMFPAQFGYRAPDWERASGTVDDVAMWWPVGHECRGRDVDSGVYAVRGPAWGLSIAVYSALAVVAGSLAMIAARIVGLMRTDAASR
ncbi:MULTISPECIES: hypothetical protein [Rhodococcus]|uniref:hypothetical protein n=1 Tax=Rhodococcus TaxID=1827 RepID=UPI00056FA8A0|nr:MULTISPECIES: hypothetical protein [Rhodococcus]RAL33775.1 hypothetical protein CVN56_12435 [Rhodococcus sp. AQ5-07]